ncbi:MAG: hypothetical protein JNK73_00545 [Bacteroidia bacterium]|nr:hypothetical protein [Bacteroidia bacterium]
MFNSVKYLLLLMGMLNACVSLFAQDPPSIKVRKSSNLAKAVFDNTSDQLIVMDRFGNPTESRILYYRLHIKLKRETKVFEGHSNKLTSEMLNFLKGLSSSTKLFFTDIKAEEEEGGHLTELPDAIEIWFPECGNCDKKRNRN